MPDGVGYFAAWTALRFSAADAIDFDLADVCVAAEKQTALLDALAELETPTDPGRVASLCQEFAVACEAGELTRRRGEIASIVDSADPYAQLADLEQHHDAWLRAAGEAYATASPTSLLLAREALLRGSRMPLGDCMRQDLVLAAQCMRHHDFAEGVRARLIDRDGAPRWDPPALGEVSGRAVAAHFEQPWPDDRLAHLGL